VSVFGEDLALALTDQFIKSVTITITVAAWHVTVVSVENAVDFLENGRGERSPAALQLINMFIFQIKHVKIMAMKLLLLRKIVKQPEVF